jgi:inhibitor of KinA
MDVHPLGDQAALVQFSDETAALEFSSVVRQTPPQWILDVVHAYSAVAVYFDPDQATYGQTADFLRQVGKRHKRRRGELGRLHVIPCCYELQRDLARVAEHAATTIDRVIALHLSVPYTVYAIGFCPGFPYLGYLPEAIAGIPRLGTPRRDVEAGSVALTGRQTGIYTERRPGGWNIIGRTPLELVNVADGYFPLRTGDRVQFHRIDELEFSRLRGQRLEMR